MKKGFTIVELLAVIAIITIILLMAVPIYFGISETMNQKVYEAKYQNLQSKSEIFAEESGRTVFDVKELIETGFLEADNELGEYIDPRDGRDMSCDIVNAVLKDDVYEVTITENKDRCYTKEELENLYGMVRIKLLDENKNPIPKITGTDWLWKKRVYATYEFQETFKEYESFLDGILWYGDSEVVCQKDNLGKCKYYEINSDLLLNTVIYFQATVNIHGVVISNEVNQKVLLDNETPKVLEGSIVVNNEYNTQNNRKVEFELTDQSGSGVASYAVVKEQGGRFTCHGASYKNASEGVQTEYLENGTYSICVKDKVGNTTSEEEVNNARNRFVVDNIDTLAPQLRVEPVDYIEGTNGWYKTMSILLTASDVGSGIKYLNYCETTEDICNPRTANVLEKNSYKVELKSNTKATKVCAEAIDGAGNKTEVACSLPYKVDLSNPSAKLKVSQSGETVTLDTSESSDSESGIAKREYKLDDGLWYTDGMTHTFTNVSEGGHTLSIRITNGAGRVSLNTKAITVVPPTLRYVTYQENTGLWKYRDSITKLVIQNKLNPISGSIQTTDESSEHDGRVKSYIVRNADNVTYTAYLQGDGKLFLNANSSYLFYQFSKLSSIEGIEILNTSKVETMAGMFYKAESLTSLDLSTFDTSKVTDMNHMFFEAEKLTSLDVSSFDTSNVTDMCYMFYFLMDLISLDVSHFDTSKVTDMSGMFGWMMSLTSLDVSHFDTRNVTDMNAMFSEMSSLTHIDLSHFNTSKVTNMRYMFSGMTSLTDLNVDSFNTSKVANMMAMFTRLKNVTNLNVSHFNTSKVTNMSYMFSSMTSLTDLDVGSFNTLNVTDMSSMFASLKSVTNLNLSHFNTSNVTDMSNMFHNMNVTTLNLTNFDTSNVINMSGMFTGMKSLTSLDIGSFDTAKVTDMSFMFDSLKSLEHLDVSHFDTSNVTDMTQMFAQNPALTYIKYGNKFIRKTNSKINYMFEDTPANKPTHSSWNGAF